MTSRHTVVARHGIELHAEEQRSGLPIDVTMVARGSSSLESVPAEEADSVAAEVADALTALASAGTMRLIFDHPPHGTCAIAERVAQRLGLTDHRDLFQLRRALPVPSDHPERRRPGALPTRPFDPGRDREAWIRQNNRAFADHPDQGAQSPTTLEATLAEPWVDLAGFLVADDPDRPGELAGSCWTRRHRATEADPELGEIFVIGVDPTRHGRGLGAHLVLAGLDELAGAGIETAMLYVDAANESARRLYDRLGFRAHLRRRLSSAPPASTGGRP